MKQLILAVLITLTSTVLSAQSKEIKDFWDYVSKNEDAIAESDNSNTSLWSNLSPNLRSINGKLGAIAGERTNDGQRIFVVTAGGDKTLFVLCDEIVKYAPRLTKLKVVSLIPPVTEFKPSVFLLGTRKIQLNFSDVKVHFDKIMPTNNDLVIILNSESYEIIQSIKNYDMSNFYYNLVIQMIMQVLGERQMVGKIGSIQMAPLNIIMPSVTLDKLRDYIK